MASAALDPEAALIPDVGCSIRSPQCSGRPNRYCHRDALMVTATWSRLGNEIGFGIGIAHGFATLGTIGFEGRFDYAAIGTVSNVASRLCD